MNSNLRMEQKITFLNKTEAKVEEKLDSPDKAYTGPSGIGASLRAKGLILCCEKESIKEKLQENEIERPAAEPGYEHLYWVTNFGNVFTRRRRLAPLGGKKLTNEKLSINTINTTTKGYYYVELYNENNKIKKIGIAILVYKTWKEKNDPEFKNDSKFYIICKDGNQLNNHISNLKRVPNSALVKIGWENSTRVRGYGIRILMFEETDEKCTKVVKTFENMHKVCEYLCVRRTLRLSGLRPDGVERKIKSARRSINKCMNGKRPTAYGYRWRWENSPPPKETVENIDGFKCLGIIEGKDLSNYEISREGIGASLRAGGLIVINKNENNQIMKHHINRYGYLYVNLSSKGKCKGFRIHRLIGRHFLDNGKSYYNSNFVINHLDENKLNNSVENLEWTTQSGNMLHSLARRVAKLDKNTLEILEIYESIKEASEDLTKNSSSGITKVCKGKRKNAYGFKWKYLTEHGAKLLRRLCVQGSSVFKEVRVEELQHLNMQLDTDYAQKIS